MRWSFMRAKLKRKFVGIKRIIKMMIDFFPHKSNINGAFQLYKRNAIVNVDDRTAMSCAYRVAFNGCNFNQRLNSDRMHTINERGA